MEPWQHTYKDKLVSAEEAAQLTKCGQKINPACTGERIQTANQTNSMEPFQQAAALYRRNVQFQS